MDNFPNLLRYVLDNKEQKNKEMISTKNQKGTKTTMENEYEKECAHERDFNRNVGAKTRYTICVKSIQQTQNSKTRFQS